MSFRYEHEFGLLTYLGVKHLPVHFTARKHTRVCHFNDKIIRLFLISKLNYIETNGIVRLLLEFPPINANAI